MPALTGRKLWAPKLALAQTWLWFIGMALMSGAMHTAGLLGAPRRTSDVSYMGMQGAQSWHPEMVLTAVGGMLLYVSILMFVAVAIGTRFVNAPSSGVVGVSPTPFTLQDEQSMAPPPAFDRLARWAGVALALLAYAGPMHDMLQMRHYLVPGMRTW